MKKSIVLSVVLVGVLSAGVMDKVDPSQSNEGFVEYVKEVNGKSTVVREKMKEPKIISDRKWLNSMKDDE